MHDPTNPRNAPPPELPLSQLETVDMDAPAEPKQDRWRWVIDRNPLFLISGVCMLGGCFLVSGVIHGYDPAEIGEGPVLMMLIALLAVLNVYEFTVIWLGLALSKSQTLVRDTRHLLGLALLLIVDASFVYNETSIFKPEIGGLIAAAAAVLGLIKVGWIVRSLGIRPTRGAIAAVATALILMYAMPIAVRLMAHDGFLNQPFAMVVWCGLGAAVALYALPLRWIRFEGRDNPDRQQLQRLVAGGLIVMPLISLIGHAAALLWVYETTFELSMISPLMLGLAAVILRQQQRLGGPAASAKAAGIVVACAVVPCLLPAEQLIIESAKYTWLAFSPLRGALLLAPLVLFWGWWITGRKLAGSIVVVLPLLLAALGHTPTVMIKHTRWLIDLVMQILPRTQLQW
ncbi:MAG: hypothetical protein AAF085_13370, partial [Planctomycetota bacterium]